MPGEVRKGARSCGARGRRLAGSASRDGGIRAARAAGTGLAALVLAAGCTKLGPDFVRPEAPVAKQWASPESPQIRPEAAEHADWWTVFRDPVLDRLVDTAYRQNLPLRIAGLRVLEARAQLGIAAGNLYPQQQRGRAGAIYTSASESNANTAGADLEFWSYDVGLDAAWELDFWGRFRRGIESADANFLASVASYDALLVSLTAEVANAYVLMRTFEARLAIARENVAIQERSLQIADVRFRNGATTELDVQQARTLLRNTQASIPALQAGLHQTRNALATLLGLPPGDVRALIEGEAVIPTAPPEVAVGIPADLLRRRPDVRAAELQAAAQSALVGVAEADLYPSIVLLGSIGLEASASTNTTKSGESGFGELFSGSSLAFVGGPAVTWNIFNYGRIKNNVRVQDARLQQLLVNYQDTVLRAAQEVEDATVGFLRSQEQAAFLSDSVQAARRSVDLSLIQYRDGATDYTRVLESQRALADQTDRLTATQGDIARNLIAMYKALGGGWQIRAGEDFVSEATKASMRDRTDWGELLAPEATRSPAPGEARETGWRRPDW